MVPNQVINSPELSNNAKMLFIYIRSLLKKPNYRHLRNKTLVQKLDLMTIRLPFRIVKGNW